MMAAADTLEVTVRGRGGPRLPARTAAPDPIPVACEIVTALQTLVTQEVRRVRPGRDHRRQLPRGDDNVIPDDARFSATVRSFSAAARDAVKDASSG